MKTRALIPSGADGVNSSGKTLSFDPGTGLFAIGDAPDLALVGIGDIKRAIRTGRYADRAIGRRLDVLGAGPRPCKAIGEHLRRPGPAIAGEGHEDDVIAAMATRQHRAVGAAAMHGQE